MEHVTEAFVNMTGAKVNSPRQKKGRVMKHVVKTSLLLVLVLALAVGFAEAKPRRAWLGVYTQSVDKDMAETFDLGADYGAIINSIVDDSPADKSRLREDDIIIAFNGQRVEDDDALVEFINAAEPGDEVTLTLMRDNDRKDVKVELGRRGNSSWYVGPGKTHKWSYSHKASVRTRGHLGVYLLNVSPETAKALGADRGGVLVNDVEEDSPAEAAGLQAGDLIVAIGDEPVSDSEDLTDVLHDMREGDTAALTIYRSSKKQTLQATVDEVESGVWYAGPGSTIEIPEIQVPDIDIDLDDLKDLDYLYLDGDEWKGEYKEAMRELRDEMKELKKELRELKRSKD